MVSATKALAHGQISHPSCGLQAGDDIRGYAGGGGPMPRPVPALAKARPARSHRGGFG